MTEITSPAIADGRHGTSRQLTSGASGVSQSEFLALLERLATNPAVDVAKLSPILDLQERVMARQAESEFNQDFIALQGRLPRIKKNGVLEYPKDKNNPDGPKRKIANYARWEDIDAELRPLLDAHGFALAFTTAPRTDGGLIITAILRHRGGHKTETPMPVPLDTSGGKNNTQGYGSALSYGKRYAATAALNIITEGEDDDGKLGGMRFITAQQVADLETLIKDTGTDENRFLQILGVAHLSNIEVGAWAAARNMLLAKKAAKIAQVQR